MSYLVEAAPEVHEEVSTATVIDSFKKLEDFEQGRSTYPKDATVTILLHSKTCPPCKRYFPDYSTFKTTSATDVRATIECGVLNDFTADELAKSPLARALSAVGMVPTVLKLGAGGAFLPAELP